jgi:aerobic C4-dicarboxylate transport protein
VAGTSSSETVLPRMMAKLEHAGCAKPVVGLVISDRLLVQPGRHLDYMSMAAIFIAQATNTELGIVAAARHPGGAAADVEGRGGRHGSGFITLAATLSSIPALPVAGLALLIGIDRFMSALAR